jgi:hypothetical protein
MLQTPIRGASCNVAGIFPGAEPLKPPATRARSRTRDFRAGGNRLAMLLRSRLLGLIYVVIGIFVAASKDYLDDLETVKRVLSAVLAIVLWPLLFLGIDLHVT